MIKEILGRFKNWFILIAIVTLAFVLSILSITFLMGFSDTESSINQITNATSAITVLNTYATVSATLAGFLTVAFIFLFQSRRSKDTPLRTYLTNLDLVLFILSIMLFAWAAFTAAENEIRVVANSDNSLPLDTGLVIEPVLIANYGFVLMAYAFGWMIGAHQAEITFKIIRKIDGQKKP